MAVVSVSRWKGSADNLQLAKEIAPVLKKHGALSVRLGRCHAGAYAGQVFGVITFSDWQAFGSAMQGLQADPDYQRIYGEMTKAFELQDRALMSVDEL